MVNNSPPERRHPLEQPPSPHPLERPPASVSDQPSRQRTTLHIPSVVPRVTYALIAINLLIFVVGFFDPVTNTQILLWGANRASNVLLGGEYYRLFTSMFLHGGLAHVAFNMYALYAVGSSLERLFGHARFLIVYLLGGLTGSVLSALLSGGQGLSVGASGAVFAIIGAEFVFLHHHRKLMGAAGQARRRSLIMFGVMNLLIGLVSALPGSQMRIDNWAHLGGLAGGFILAWFISPMLDLKPHPEKPNEIMGVDANPLNRNVWPVSLFATALVVLIFIGVMLARG